MQRNVLVCGAGIAGATVAFWLARCGFRPTVVERAPSLRAGGAPIDVRGDAVDVAERMGVLDRIQQARTDIRQLRFVDDSGKRVGGLDMGRFQRSHDVELMRGDLTRILHEASGDDVEYVFGDQPTGLREDADGVEVTFACGHARTFDLVVGADGLHSAVRELAFGPEEEFRHYLGYYAAVIPVPAEFGEDRAVLLHNTPGTVVALYRSGNHDDAKALFLARQPTELSGEYRDVQRQKQFVLDTFAGQSWHVPALLDRVRDAEDFFFDSLSQIWMPTWSAGRIVLLGDAAHAPALLSGAGSSLAMVGAERLARELVDGDDHGTAFRRYEAGHLPAVTRGQRGASSSARVLVPGTRLGLWSRNHLSRLASPITALATKTGSGS